MTFYITLLLPALSLPILPCPSHLTFLPSFHPIGSRSAYMVTTLFYTGNAVGFALLLRLCSHVSHSAALQPCDIKSAIAWRWLRHCRRRLSIITACHHHCLNVADAAARVTSTAAAAAAVTLLMPIHVTDYISPRLDYIQTTPSPCTAIARGLFHYTSFVYITEKSISLARRVFLI